jgi:DNA repair ATPase RecN
MVSYLAEIRRAQNLLVELKTERKIKESLLLEKTKSIEHLNQMLVDSEKARIVVQAVASKVQQDLEYRITNIVTMALAAVFNDPYEFKVQFVTRRNQTECDMFFVKDGNECDPMDSSGGGAIDIASLALRMAIWSIKKTRAIQILDEPAKFLSRDMQDKCSEMLQELSAKLGIQLIVVSHIPEMITAADRVFHVEQNEGVSRVRTIS